MKVDKYFIRRTVAFIVLLATVFGLFALLAKLTESDTSYTCTTIGVRVERGDTLYDIAYRYCSGDVQSAIDELVDTYGTDITEGQWIALPTKVDKSETDSMPHRTDKSPTQPPMKVDKSGTLGNYSVSVYPMTLRASENDRRLVTILTASTASARWKRSVSTSMTVLAGIWNRTWSCLWNREILTTFQVMPACSNGGSTL